jgi:peptide-methionine (S)-S-oxide reductase
MMVIEALIAGMIIGGTVEGGAQKEEAVFGGGCFWCVEAIYERIDGVLSVQSGYAGGTVKNPTYEEVCTGSTGHAEVVKITFDPAKVSYRKLVDLFWEAHDPTTLNRQGADVGTQYRSIILYRDDHQQKDALESKAAAQKEFGDSIVTVIEPLKEFYPAEKYHQEYYSKNSGAPYCRFVIAPKLKKLGLQSRKP